MKVYEDIIQLYIESDSYIKNPVYLEAEEENSRLKKVLEAIQKFFTILGRKIVSFFNESRVSMALIAIRNASKNNRKFNSYKIAAMDFDLYDKSYRRYIAELKQMNVPLDKIRDVDSYREKLEDIQQEFIDTVDDIQNEYSDRIDKPSNMTTVSALVTKSREILEDIKRNGASSYPIPANSDIARAFSRASGECGKMCAAVTKQLRKVISDNTLNTFLGKYLKM